MTFEIESFINERFENLLDMIRKPTLEPTEVYAYIKRLEELSLLARSAGYIFNIKLELVKKQ